MLNLNMLLFSTSDFICIGIVRPTADDGDCQWRDRIFRLVRPSASCAIALGVLFQSGVPMPLAILLTFTARRIVRS